MLTPLEQELLAALKLARNEISAMAQHYGEGPPEVDYEVSKQLQKVYEKAESLRLGLPEVIPNWPETVTVASIPGWDFEVYKADRDGHIRGRIMNTSKKRFAVDGSLFHGIIETWEAKETHNWH